MSDKARAEAAEADQMGVEFTKEEIYPIINGKNFVTPVPGLKASDIGGADFHQNRGAVTHHAIDLFPKFDENKQRGIGNPVLAVADGKVTFVHTVEKYTKSVGGYADFVNERINEDKLFDDIIAALDKDAKAYEAKRPKTAKQFRNLRDAIKTKKRNNTSIPLAPGDSWESFRQWSNKNIGYGIGSRMLRYHRKNIDDPRARLGTGGAGVTITTDPDDQNGRKYDVYYCHLNAIDVKFGDTVKAGQKIAELGNTAIFDNNGQHLHMHMRLRGGAKIDPETLIPGLDSNRKEHVPYYSKQEVKIMNRKNLKQIVSEMLKENSGAGYNKYPYNSNEYHEEEPDQDYQVEWNSFVDEVCGPRKKAVDGDPSTFEDIAIEVAKIFVKDSDLFREVLEMAGNNKSIGTEILRQLKDSREK